MILKIKNEHNCWSYFEGDQVIVHKVKTLKLGSYDDTLSFIRLDAEHIKDADKEYLSLCICKEKKVSRRILTNQSTYLMNDQGKTVDKLF